MSLVRPVWVFHEDKIGPSKRGRSLSKTGILGVGGLLSVWAAAKDQNEQRRQTETHTHTHMNSELSALSHLISGAKASPSCNDALSKVSTSFVLNYLLLWSYDLDIAHTRESRARNELVVLGAANSLTSEPETW